MQNFLDWLVIGLRWAHIVAILGWVGVSFYFRWLDSKLRVPDPRRENVLGEAWMGHGGGFYIVEKRHVPPGRAPSPVYWFRVEAAVTWITGFLLLVFVYYWDGGIGLVDPATSVLGPKAAVAFAIGLLVVSWFVYDRIWVSRLAENDKTTTPAKALSFILLFAVVYLLCELFTGRAAFLHVGAILGTNMVANVWTRIIPAQVETIAATAAGRERNQLLALRAARRSTHNTYLTLPVIFAMIAVHAPVAYTHPLNWLILSLLIVVGIAARHLMITFDRGQAEARAWAPAGTSLAASLVVLGFLTAPVTQSAPSESLVPFTVVRGVVDLRCASCHSRKPSDTASFRAPQALSFDTPQQIRAHAARIKASVLDRSMPLGNRTGMTQEERALITRWVDQGARID